MEYSFIKIETRCGVYDVEGNCGRGHCLICPESARLGRMLTTIAATRQGHNKMMQMQESYPLKSTLLSIVYRQGRMKATAVLYAKVITIGPRESSPIRLGKSKPQPCAIQHNPEILRILIGIADRYRMTVSWLGSSASRLEVPNPGMAGSGDWVFEKCET